MIDKDEFWDVARIVIVAIAIIFGTPIMAILALNALFDTRIELSVSSWLGAFALIAILRGTWTTHGEK